MPRTRHRPGFKFHGSCNSAYCIFGRLRTPHRTNMPDRHCPKGAGASSEGMLWLVCRCLLCMPGLCGGTPNVPAAGRQPTVAREIRARGLTKQLARLRKTGTRNSTAVPGPPGTRNSTAVPRHRCRTGGGCATVHASSARQAMRYMYASAAATDGGCNRRCRTRGGLRNSALV